MWEAPFGIKFIQEMYQRFMTVMIQDLEGTQVIANNIIVRGENIQEHEKKTKANVIQNAAKKTKTNFK